MGMSVLSSDGMCCGTSILGIATPPENRSCSCFFNSIASLLQVDYHLCKIFFSTVTGYSNKRSRTLTYWPQRTKQRRQRLHESCDSLGVCR